MAIKVSRNELIAGWPYENEDIFQHKAFFWAITDYPELKGGRLFHVPNGGTRDKREAAKFKAMGVIRGEPDLILLKDYKTFGLELKQPDGEQSLSQKSVQASWNGHAYYFLIWSAEDFCRIVDGIMNNLELFDNNLKIINNGNT